jgi:hypothetical protein
MVNGDKDDRVTITPHWRPIFFNGTSDRNNRGWHLGLTMRLVICLLNDLIFHCHWRPVRSGR